MPDLSNEKKYTAKAETLPPILGLLQSRQELVSHLNEEAVNQPNKKEAISGQQSDRDCKGGANGIAVGLEEVSEPVRRSAIIGFVEPAAQADDQSFEACQSNRKVSEIDDGLGTNEKVKKDSSKAAAEEIQGPGDDSYTFRLNGYSADELVAYTVPGLTFYQQMAKPRVKASDDSVGKELVSVKHFGDLFKCSICFRALKGPVAVRSCLHKFCQNCLEELHRSSKHCPQCRSPIISRRVWRQDSRFAAILDILIDDIDNYNSIEAECLEQELKKIFDFNLFSKVMSEHFERQ